MIPSLISRFLIYSYGTLRPAYLTYNSLCENKADEYQKWSKYWILYALLICCEAAADIFLLFIPLYEEIKLVIVLWIVLTAPQASVWMFDAILHPIYSRYQAQLEYLCCSIKDRLVGYLVFILANSLFWAQSTILPTLKIVVGDRLVSFFESLPGASLLKQSIAETTNQNADKNETDDGFDDLEDEFNKERPEAGEEQDIDLIVFKKKPKKFPMQNTTGHPLSLRQEITNSMTEENDNQNYSPTNIFPNKELRHRSSHVSQASFEA